MTGKCGTFDKCRSPIGSPLLNLMKQQLVLSIRMWKGLLKNVIVTLKFITLTSIPEHIRKTKKIINDISGNCTPTMNNGVLNINVILETTTRSIIIRNDMTADGDLQEKANVVYQYRCHHEDGEPYTLIERSALSVVVIYTIRQVAQSRVTISNITSL